MQTERLTFDLITELEHTHSELDTISETKVFDVSYEIWWYNFYFRCTKSINNYHDQENTIEFLQEDSDYCDEEVLEFMKDEITELYL